MIKLIKTKDETNKFDRTNVTFEIDDNSITLDDLVMEMNDFIKAIGYSLQDRYLDVVQNTSNKVVKERGEYHVVHVDDGDHIIDTYYDRCSMDSAVKSIQSSNLKSLICVIDGEQVV